MMQIIDPYDPLGTFHLKDPLATKPGKGPGISPRDVDIFLEVAREKECILLLRSTNPASLEYLDDHTTCPKDIDCKPKTAEKNVGPIKCAGLVVDPTRSPYAFESKEKREKSIEAWRKFCNPKRLVRERQIGGERKPANTTIIRRADGTFYIVDIFNPDRHGCLMVTEKKQLPECFFYDASDPIIQKACADFLKEHAKYIHGDYDLYGIITAKGVILHASTLLGQTNVVNATIFNDIKEALNRKLRKDMIRHGSQDNVELSGDSLLLFFPDGSAGSLQLSHQRAKSLYRACASWLVDFLKQKGYADQRLMPLLQFFEARSLLGS